MNGAGMQPDDAQLVEAAIKGDTRSFDRLMDRHASRCYRIARRLGLSPEDAADAVQETFLAAFRALDSFNFAFQFSTWLTRILVNRALNMRRALQRGRRFFLKPQHDTDVEFDEPAPNPHQLLEHAEMHAAFEKAVKRLPQKQRTVFVLFEFEDFKTREIASILDIPEGTVTSRLHAARAAVRHDIQQMGF